MRENKQEDLQLNTQLRAFMQGLKCQNQYPIQRICNNADCQKPALFCSNSECQNCHEAHNNCGSYLFQKFTRQVQKKTAGSLSEFYQRMNKIQCQFIQRIQKSKRKFLHAFSLEELTSSMDQKYYHMIKSIYRDKNAQAITGKEAHQLFDKLLQTDLDQGCRQLELLQTFQQQNDRLLKEYLSTKDWIFDAELGQHRFKKKLKEKQNKKTNKISIESTVLQSYKKQLKLQQLLGYPNKKVQMFANIISEEIQKIDNQYIFQELSKPLSVQLAFRASRHHFSAAEFHQMCDGIQGTLILARNEYEKVIGAYTPLSWYGQGYKGDEKFSTFIFGLNSKVRLNLVNPTKAIYCNRSMGPTFGGEAFMFNLMHSYDFSISDDCDNNRNSSMSFPRSFRFHERPVQIVELSGLTNGGHFRIVEYEVYKVVYDQRIGL